MLPSKNKLQMSLKLGELNARAVESKPKKNE